LDDPAAAELSIAAHAAAMGRTRSITSLSPSRRSTVISIEA
jgi:hypothetical protein